MPGPHLKQAVKTAARGDEDMKAGTALPICCLILRGRSYYFRFTDEKREVTYLKSHS